MCILSVFILVTYRNGKVCAKVLHIIQQLFSLKGFLESFQRFGCWRLWHPIWGKKTRFQESVLGTKRIYRVESTLYGNRPFMGYLSMFFFQLLKCQIAETLAKSPQWRKNIILLKAYFQFVCFFSQLRRKEMFLMRVSQFLLYQNAIQAKTPE